MSINKDELQNTREKEYNLRLDLDQTSENNKKERSKKKKYLEN